METRNEVLLSFKEFRFEYLLHLKEIVGQSLIFERRLFRIVYPSVSWIKNLKTKLIIICSFYKLLLDVKWLNPATTSI